MRKLLLACALFLIWPVAASSGPKEDALLVVEQFKKAFDASDVEGVVKLFAPDAVFLGTVSPVLGQRFLGLNHIRRPRRVCRTTCG